MKNTALTLVAGLAVAIALAGPTLAQSYGAQPYGAPPPPPGAYGQGGPPPPGDFRHDDDHGGWDHRDHGGWNHPGGDHGGGWEIGRRIQWIQDRINRGRADGSLNRREFRNVQFQLNAIRRWEDGARERGGGQLDDHARFDLQARLDHLNDQIHWLRQNDERRPW